MVRILQNFPLTSRRGLVLAVLTSFIFSGIPLVPAQSQALVLPAPGVMVYLSQTFDPPILKGIKVHTDNPFRFDFILDKGESQLSNIQLKDESSKLIKYFLASLTIPDNDLWVNLSPYEKNRIIPRSFGLTEMGRDLLAEDYMLKQITASLIYPEDGVGKKFWNRVYEEAAKKFGTTDIPVNTFNKVWIMSEKAVVYENANAGTAYVVDSRLKVMLEQDFLALSHNTLARDMFIGSRDAKQSPSTVNALGSQIVREIVIPELTREVNKDKNFAQLRQAYSSLILAAWYKRKIKDSILEQVYADKKKVAGLGYKNFDIEAIYQRYLSAFKKGVYNYIKEEQDPVTQQIIPKKYFSGGMLIVPQKIDYAMSSDARLLSAFNSPADRAVVVEVNVSPQAAGPGKDQAMNAAAPHTMPGVADTALLEMVRARLRHYYNSRIPQYSGAVGEGGEAKIYYDANDPTHKRFYKIFTNEGEQNEDEIVYLKYLELKGVSGIPKVLDWGFTHNDGFVTSSDFEKDFSNGAVIFDWLMRNNYFRERNGDRGHPNVISDMLVLKLEKEFPHEYRKILEIGKRALEVWVHMEGIQEAQSIQLSIRGTIAKSDINKLGSNGQIILEELIKQKVVNDISSTKVRLNAGLDQKESLVKEIVKHFQNGGIGSVNFGEIWDLLLQANGLEFSKFWNRLSFAERLDKLAKVAKILSEAHKVGISHNDVKPLNVIINNEGEVMIIDWNIATKIGDVQPMGTMEYAAPEEVTKRDKSDVFALGKTVYNSLRSSSEYFGETDVARLLRYFEDRMILPYRQAYDRPSMEESVDYLEKIARKAADPEIKLEEWRPVETSMTKNALSAIKKAAVKLFTKKDAAMTNGGIDMIPADMNLQFQNSGGAIKFHLDPIMVRQLQNAAGFVPTIINIRPITNLKAYLGLEIPKPIVPSAA
jgi:serine/threonine protein kinase